MAPPVIDVQPVPFVDGIVYGEGPRWHDGRLWFTDGFADRVYSVGESGDIVVEAHVPSASGLGWLPDGTLVVSALFDTKIYHVDPRGVILTTFDVSDIAWSTNDLLVTPGGHVYVDIYAEDRNGGDGVGLVSHDGSVQIVASGLSVPNGLGLLPDGTLVLNETRGPLIHAFPVHPDGTLGASSVFADLGHGRQPDGLCVDVEGGVWVGCFSTGEFLRVIKGDTITHRVEIDKGWAVAPALGGADGRTLYMMIDDTTIEGLGAKESTGWIMSARVDVPGAGSP